MSMAAATGGATTSLRHQRRHFPVTEFCSKKPVPILCSISTPPFPLKPTKRQNHLRLKLLKTLIKPVILKTPPANPNNHLDSSPVLDAKELEDQESESENLVHGDKEFEELRESQVLEQSAVVFSDDSVGKSWVLKYVLWLVGAFIFQSVCVVWALGGAEINSKDGIFDEERGAKSRGFVNSDGNGDVGSENGGAGSTAYVDQVEMERRIKEIREMVREVRRNEKLEPEKDGIDSEGDGGSKSRIEEEVDNRLVKLRKKLESVPVALIGRLKSDNEGKQGFGKGKIDEREGNGVIMFKKKHKFKELPSEKPKGFMGSTDHTVDNVVEDEVARVGNDGDAFDLGGQLILSDGESQRIDTVHVDENYGQKKDMLEETASTKTVRNKVAKERGTTKKQEKKKGIAKPKITRDTGQQKNQGKLTAEPVRSRKLSSGALETAAVSNKLSDDLDVIRDDQSAKKCKNEPDLWWLSLPYVLGILMYRGRDGEGGHGLYTLKSSSSEHGDLSYTVAFEDHVDAKNFSYLLQSFFDDLEDFGADVVPLTIKELSEAVRSGTMRMIVVRKGQLRVYAGQPLSEAETALRSLPKNKVNETLLNMIMED